MFRRHIRAERAHRWSLGILLALYTLGGLAAASEDEGPEIWFIRHAESEINVVKGPLPQPDRGVSYPLTATGVQQAAVLGARFVGVPVSHLYSSTRLRTLETAAAISRQSGVPITLAPDVVEIDFGDAPDLYRDVPEIVGEWLGGDPEARLRGEGENLVEVRARVQDFWDALRERHAGDDGLIVVVTHGGIIGFALPELCAEVDSELLTRYPIDNTDIVRARLVGNTLQCQEWDGLALPAETGSSGKQ